MSKKSFEDIGGVRFYDNPNVDGVTDRRVFVTEPPRKGAVKIQKGVEFDCAMFDVRCKQECVSGGVRHTDKCPYDNYKKGGENMGKSNKPTAPITGNSGDSNADNSGNGGFTPTFRKYADMSEGERAAFRQGAKTSENKVKERLGFTKPRG